MFASLPVAEADVPEPDEPSEDDEEEEFETDDGPDAWHRVEEVAAEREADPDADLVETRWKDPFAIEVSQLGIDEKIAPLGCAGCTEVRSLRACRSCGEPFCTDCAVTFERGEISCRPCLDEAAAADRPSYDDPIFDGIVEDPIEAPIETVDEDDYDEMY